LLAVVATIIIVNKTRSIDAEKDREVKIATDAANLKIAQAGSDAAKALSDAATANQKAQEAKLKAQETERSNTSLKVELNKHEEQEKENEIKLAAQNQQTAQFTQALQFQQQTMAQQIHVSPELNNAQIDAIAAELKPFAGQEVIIHRTDDTVVGRLASSIANAFLRAGIKFPQYSDDISQLYQGVTVVVHAPDQGHPPMADALVNALMRQGIPVNKGAIDSVPMGAVALYLGPQ
jgi:flagellar biosynthesis GTPase FlhF